ncbi:MAG: hypothetical protein ACE5ER_09440 [Nitrospinaceae bacterium]
MNEKKTKSVHQEVLEEIEEERSVTLGRRIGFWVSFLMATAIALWYFQGNPPESEEVKRMRLFFKENNREVMEFIRLPLEELKVAARKKTHPFYMSFVKASVNEKGRIKALIHTSTDYTPNQYWVNLFFLWTIVFAASWFLSLMTQGVIMLLKRDTDFT